MTTNRTPMVRPFPVSRFSGTVSVPQRAAIPATVHDLAVSEPGDGELPHEAAARPVAATSRSDHGRRQIRLRRLVSGTRTEAFMSHHPGRTTAKLSGHVRQPQGRKPAACGTTVLS